jgi:hypothetical protein
MISKDLPSRLLKATNVVQLDKRRLTTMGLFVKRNIADKVAIAIERALFFEALDQKKKDEIKGLYNKLKTEQNKTNNTNSNSNSNKSSSSSSSNITSFIPKDLTKIKFSFDHNTLL